MIPFSVFRTYGAFLAKQFRLDFFLANIAELENLETLGVWATSKENAKNSFDLPRRFILDWFGEPPVMIKI